MAEAALRDRFVDPHAGIDPANDHDGAAELGFSLRHGGRSSGH
jgi:hypothetical protein